MDRSLAWVYIVQARISRVECRGLTLDAGSSAQKDPSCWGCDTVYG